MTGLWRAAAGWLVLASLACAPPPQGAPPVAPRAATDVRELPARPSVAVVVRQGDPRPAVAVAVLTAGVDEPSGARVPVGLAALVEARLTAHGVRDVTVAPTWEGYRVRALLPTGSGGAAAVLLTIRDALLAPVPPTGPELDTVRRKLALFAARRVSNDALAEAARCMDEPFARGRVEPPPVTPSALEAWRAASHGLGRVVFGVTGTAGDVDAVTSALLEQPAWPRAATATQVPGPAPTPGAESVTASPLLYDAADTLPIGAARVTVLARTRDPDAAMAAAKLLGAPTGPLARRLHALDLPGSVRDVTATAHPDGGCLAVTLDVPRTHDSGEDTRSLATAAAVARQETRWTARMVDRRAPDPRPATLAGDPREAAELAAWWALAGTLPGAVSAVPSDSVMVGLGPDAEAAHDFAARARSVSAELDRAFAAWQSPVVEAHTEVEPGQGALWLVLASPCGTLSEGDADAGLTALAVSALAEQAHGAARDGDAELTEWITSHGAGLLVRAVRHDRESSLALAGRAADAVGAAMMAVAVDPGAIAAARARLIDLAGKDDPARSFATLAEALRPGHPSAVFPLAAGKGLVGSSDSAVVSRIAALRRGPLRLAVLGDDDAAEAQAAVQAVDRWVPHGADGPRACAASFAAPPPRPGTYAAPPATSHSAWLAVPLPRGSSAPSVHDAAAATAAALEGADGLLARALSGGLASSWSARLVGAGAGDEDALVIRVVSSAHALDAAVAQVRALLDHLQRGAFTDADRTRAAARLADDALRVTLTPRGRLLRLWHGQPTRPPADSAPPTLDAMHAFHADVLRDDSLVIVASRPGAPAQGRGTP